MPIIFLSLGFSAVALLISLFQARYQRVQARHAPKTLEAHRVEAKSAELMTRLAVIPILSLTNVRLLWREDYMISISADLENIGSGPAIDMKLNLNDETERESSGTFKRAIPIVLAPGTKQAVVWQAGSRTEVGQDDLRLIVGFEDVMSNRYRTEYTFQPVKGSSQLPDLRMKFKHIDRERAEGMT